MKKQFRGDISMAKKIWKMFSIQGILKIYIKTTVGNHFPPIRLAKIEGLKTWNVDKDLGKGELFYNVVGV